VLGPVPIATELVELGVIGHPADLVLADVTARGGRLGRGAIAAYVDEVRAEHRRRRVRQRLAVVADEDLSHTAGLERAETMLGLVS
jgi:hypothetical protein